MPGNFASKLSLLASVLLAVSIDAGCSSYNYSERMLHKPVAHSAGGVDEPDVTADAGNSARLKSLPPAVQLRFNNDNAGANVTNVEMKPTGTGAMLYRIVYIQAGKPGEALYRADGSAVGADDSGAVVLPGQSDVPLTRPSVPATTPAQFQ